PGQGTEIAVSLPLLPASPYTQAETLPPPKRKRRVLVIEDNEDAAETLKEALEFSGHEVEVAYDGTRGDEKARRFQPEGVICDIGVPGIDGYEVAQALRSEPELGNAFMVALSGYAQREDLERAKAAGFDEHVAKPPTLATLNRLVIQGRRIA